MILSRDSGVIVTGLVMNSNGMECRPQHNEDFSLFCTENMYLQYLLSVGQVDVFHYVGIDSPI